MIINHRLSLINYSLSHVLIMLTSNWLFFSTRIYPGDSPRCGAWRPSQARPLNLPPGCGPGDPPRPVPLTSPLGVGLETPPPGQTPQAPPGCGPGNLQGMLGYPWRPAKYAGIPPARHAGIPPAPL